MINVPFRELSAQALRGVVDAFILREGTDYGHQDYDMESKRRRVLAQLESGEAAIFYYPESDYVNLQMVNE